MEKISHLAASSRSSNGIFVRASVEVVILFGKVSQDFYKNAWMKLKMIYLIEEQNGVISRNKIKSSHPEIMYEFI